MGSVWLSKGPLLGIDADGLKGHITDSTSPSQHSKLKSEEIGAWFKYL